ncbi:Ig-like domain-containing protein [Mumia sp. Pv 4-285]|uniref:Ig-like domain-containing protein n=1 Tax=Mumia qirimensis TaxID=3234852 RepID=UPI00351D1BB0
MLSFVPNASRRLLAGVLAALLAVGLLAAAPPASAATTLTYNGWTETWADGDLWISFTAAGDEPVGTATATFAGKTVTLERSDDNPNPHQYMGTINGPFPVGTHTVTGKLVTTSGTVTATGSATVLPALRYAAPGSAFSWGVDPLRTKVLAEGGSVALSSGAVKDTTDAAKVSFPMTDYLKGSGRYETGGLARFVSRHRDVTLSDLHWVTAGQGGSLRADATYRHPGQATRSERGVVIATAPVIYGQSGDPMGFRGSVDLAATAAGARILGVSTAASLGTMTWRVALALNPSPASARVIVSPTSTSYGRAARVTASVTRAGTYAAGTVAFRAGSRGLGTVRLSRGAGAMTVPAGIAVGTHAITATYRADYSPTTAVARTSLRITKAGTVTKARLSKKKVTRKQRAKVTATVAGRGTTIRPTGTVKIYDGKKRVGKATLTVGKRGKVTVKLPKLKKRGRHTLRIVYSGSWAFGGSSTRVVLRVR